MNYLSKGAWCGEELVDGYNRHHGDGDTGHAPPNHHRPLRERVRVVGKLVRQLTVGDDAQNKHDLENKKVFRD